MACGGLLCHVHTSARRRGVDPAFQGLGLGSSVLTASCLPSTGPTSWSWRYTEESAGG